MSTLTLKEAAKLLRVHPSTLGAQARAGQVPAVKVGRAWLFIEADLMSHLRSQYTPCRSTGAKALTSGTSISRSQVSNAYVNQLEQMIASRRRSTTIN